MSAFEEQMDGSAPRQPTRASRCARRSAAAVYRKLWFRSLSSPIGVSRAG